MFSKAETTQIIDAIDAFAWKHSIHLPRDGYGHIDWRNPATLQECQRLLEGYRKSSLKFAYQCDELTDVIAKGQQRLADIEAEEQEDESNDI